MIIDQEGLINVFESIKNIATNEGFRDKTKLQSIISTVDTIILNTKRLSDQQIREWNQYGNNLDLRAKAEDNHMRLMVKKFHEKEEAMVRSMQENMCGEHNILGDDNDTNA